MATTLPPSSAADPARSPFTRLGRQIWHRDAPKKISRLCLPGEAGEGWQLWQQYLSERKKPSPLAKLLGSTASPLAWAVPEELYESGTVAWIKGLLPEAKKQKLDPQVVTSLDSWLAETATAPPSVAFALEALAVAHALPALAEHLAADLWWNLLQHLTLLAREAELHQESKPLTGQLLAGELPLALAYLLPELRPCRELAERAKKNLSEGLVELLDGEGLPHARHFHLLRPLLACWTRAHAMGSRIKGGAFSREARLQYEWLVLNAIRFSRHDGSQLFARSAASAWEPELFAAALQQGGSHEDKRAALVALPGGKPKRAKRISDADLPESPGTSSEWSGLGLLRPSWSKSSPRLAVDYSKPLVQIELDLGAGVVLSGPWQLHIELDGERLEPAGEWEETCWNSDEEGDYLEIELPMTCGVHVQRQMFFAREDGFLYLCDVVLGEQAGKLVYRGVLPLAPSMTFAAAEESREGFLLDTDSGKQVGLVLPLALPEWRVDPRHGNLSATAHGLELQQQAAQRNLAAPLFFDFDRRRIAKEATWRQLTVAERLEIQPPETAVGYRVQCGSEQWLFYRSLAEPANRTVLGQNLISEFLCARFDYNGDADQLIEIEGSEEE